MPPSAAAAGRTLLLGLGPGAGGGLAHSSRCLTQALAQGTPRTGGAGALLLLNQLQPQAGHQSWREMSVAAAAAAPETAAAAAAGQSQPGRKAASWATWAAAAGAAVVAVAASASVAHAAGPPKAAASRPVAEEASAAAPTEQALMLGRLHDWLRQQGADLGAVEIRPSQVHERTRCLRQQATCTATHWVYFKRLIMHTCVVGTVLGACLPRLPAWQVEQQGKPHCGWRERHCVHLLRHQALPLLPVQPLHASFFVPGGSRKHRHSRSAQLGRCFTCPTLQAPSTRVAAVMGCQPARCSWPCLSALAHTPSPPPPQPSPRLTTTPAACTCVCACVQAGPGAGLGVFATQRVGPPARRPWWLRWLPAGGSSHAAAPALATFPLSSAITADAACADPQLGPQFRYHARAAGCVAGRACNAMYGCRCGCTRRPPWGALT